MNKIDHLDRKQGYWEEEMTKVTWKGVFVDDDKVGIWKCFNKNDNKISTKLSFSEDKYIDWRIEDGVGYRSYFDSYIFMTHREEIY